MAQLTEGAFRMQMVSGFRTATEQLRQVDGAAVDVSTHTSCPATGADLQVIGTNKQNAPVEIRRVFKQAGELAGLRVGGGSSTDPLTGLPSDWNHVDLGPRAR